MLELHIAVVDNEKEALDSNVLMIERFADANKIAKSISTYLNPFDFLNAKEEFDVVFMDIDMPAINGMDVANEMRKRKQKIDIIFITNLPQFAVDGYKVNALDFVIKPITYANISFALDKVVEKKRNVLNGYFFLKIGGFLRRFDNDEMLYFEMANHNILMYLNNGEILKIRGSLKLIEEVVNDNVFVKINSGIVINLSKVKTFEDGVVIMVNNERLPISRSHKKDFATRLAKFYSNSLN